MTATAPGDAAVRRLAMHLLNLVEVPAKGGGGFGEGGDGGGGGSGEGGSGGGRRRWRQRPRRIPARVEEGAEKEVFFPCP